MSDDPTDKTGSGWTMAFVLVVLLALATVGIPNTSGHQGGGTVQRISASQT